MLLYRIGRAPNPLDFPPHDVIGSNRFDDPARTYRVLYAAEQRRGAFIEVLAPFRPALADLARLQALRGDQAASATAGPRLTADWFQQRRLGLFRLGREQSWLDLRQPETLVYLRGALAGTLVAFGLDDFDMGDALTRHRPLTQALSRWTFTEGLQGVVYKSRFDVISDCWAIFEGVVIEPVDVLPLTPTDPDFQSAAQLLQVSIDHL